MAKKKEYRTEWPQYDRFAKLLEDHGVTTLFVSKETGVNSTSLYEWKSGRSYPKEDKLKKLAHYFNVPMNYFQDGNMNEERLSLDDIQTIIRYAVREEVRAYLKEVFSD